MATTIELAMLASVREALSASGLDKSFIIVPRKMTREMENTYLSAPLPAMRVGTLSSKQGRIKAQARWAEIVKVCDG